MNDIHKKLLSGEKLTEGEWEGYLQHAHREVQSMTPRALGAYRTSGGQNTYEVLANVLAKKKGKDLHVLDLGCGDGYLVQYILRQLGPRGKVTGIDMVPTEIERAKTAFGDKRAQFICGRAQELALPPNSVDVVLCHMSLMLIRPLEAMIDKVHVMLKGGGELAGIVTAPPRYGTPAFELSELIAAFLDSKQPGMRKAFEGVDPRFSSEEGLQGLFKRFKDDLWLQDLDIIIPTDTESLWNYERDMYLIGALPQPAKLELKDKMNAFVSKLKASGMKLSVPLRLFQVTR